MEIAVANHASGCKLPGAPKTRERLVLPLVVSGLLSKQIAAEIGTSEATIKVHRSQLMRKMGAKSVADLVRMAEKMGVFVTKQS
jgi:FixJ family two-component response regulator